MKTLYTTTRRAKGAKWAHVRLFAIQDNELQLIAEYKYQPAATPGHRYEAQRAYFKATGKDVDNTCDVRDLEDMR
jgi:hypothetical protein